MPTRTTKADLRRLAAEARLETGFQPAEPFDPWAMADHYGIKVIPLTESGCGPAALQHFSADRSDVLSAILIPDGNGWTISENDSHEMTRRRSNVAHELGHVLCEHRGVGLLQADGSCRAADADKENEAHEVMGELLIPSGQAIRMAVRRRNDQFIADHFQVSLQMARWRVNVSGARTIAKRQSMRR
jgi:hypothetical protein